MSLPPDDSTSLTPGFQFVNISEPADMKAPEHRKFVRKSVAFNQRKKQVLGLSSASGQSSPPHSSTKAGDFHQSYCQACGISIQTRRDSSSSSDRRDDSLYLFAARVDPFSSFPIPSRPYMHVLVDHYLTVYCPTLLPFGKWDGRTSPITTRLFPLAIQNPVYFHALLCIAATHYGILSGQQTFKAVACYHRGEAIKLLSEIIQDGNGGVTDLVIAAAGSLAHHDIIVGDIKALENHKKGMIAMIRVRGGIDNAGLDCLIKFRAYWIDMVSAYYAQTKPSLPIEGVSFMTSQHNHSLTLAETGFLCLLNICCPSSPMIKGLQELVSLTTDIRGLSGGTPSQAELYSFTGRRTYIEWGLSTFELSYETKLETAIKSCCCLSAQIYVNIVLRKMELGYAVLSHLANKLKNALYQKDLNPMWGDKAQLLIWVLFQGGAVATEEGIRKWYISHLVSCFRHSGLQTWNDVIELLGRFLWVSLELEKLCKPLWYEIAIGLSDFETSEVHTNK